MSTSNTYHVDIPIRTNNSFYPCKLCYPIILKKLGFTSHSFTFFVLFSLATRLASSSGSNGFEFNKTIVAQCPWTTFVALISLDSPSPWILMQQVMLQTTATPTWLDPKSFTIKGALIEGTLIEKKMHTWTLSVFVEMPCYKGLNQ